MNNNNFGKVEYYTLTDEKNLSYKSDKTTKISVFTPPDYDKSKSYPLLIMFDGQNLYKQASGREPNKDSHGSWAVDVAVCNRQKNGLVSPVIVGIDNSDGYRDQELTMSENFGDFGELEISESFLNGKLEDVGQFLTETVLPFVRKNYSVSSDREKTAISGSSSGGLASYYLGLRYNELFGFIGAFSPANALFSDKAWKNFYRQKDFSVFRPQIYVYSGFNDGFIEDDLIKGAKKILDLVEYGYDEKEISERYIEFGLHNESFWRAVFPDFLDKFLNR